jgi:NADH-quinone oxidoreductase subunit G/[NiFe] hydrogenase diaphorase moiety small subunit
MSGDVKPLAETSRAPSSQAFQKVPVSGDMSQLIGGQITVNIDGTDVKVPMGTTILDAAKQVGVRIPTLCHHPDLCVAGVCRMCVVEVEGQRALQAACAYPVTSSLKVKTHTRKVRQARRHVLDLLLSTHYG